MQDPVLEGVLGALVQRELHRLRHRHTFTAHRQCVGDYDHPRRSCPALFPGHRILHQLGERRGAEPLGAPHLGSQSTLADDDRVGGQVAEVRLEAAEHLVAHRLPVFGSVEVLQVEPGFERIVLGVQQRRQMAEGPSHDHAGQGEELSAVLAEVEVAGLVDVQVHRAARRF